ncbi:MAG TPA: DUF5683 domain-containing protein [Gemmatimonadota bacterium]|nr:DUF5683 domain-containing protein [Gemmatimonadota bacterium]
MGRATPALAAATLALLVFATAPAAAQEVRPSEAIPLDSLEVIPADTLPILEPRFREGGGPERLSRVPSEDLLPRNPRNAAIRAFLIPGWGSFYTGHPWRGVMWAAAQGGFFTLGYRKQLEALDLQDDLQAAREAFAATAPDSLLEDPIALEAAFDRTPEAIGIRSDLDQTEERREDWYAYFALSTIFAAVDAYVSAQLDPIRVGRDGNGRMTAELRLPVGRDP